MSAVSSDESQDLYRESFKYFKSFHEASPKKACKRALQMQKHPPRQSDSKRSNGGTEEDTYCEGCLSAILLSYPAGLSVKEEKGNTPRESALQMEEVGYDPNCDCYKWWGLTSPDTWNVVRLTFPEGLIVVRNPFTAAGQRYWISRTLLDFPHHQEYITNMDNLNRLQKLKKGECVEVLKDFKLDTCSKDFYSKLRWVTFGYHHDWDTKIYSEQRKSKFPEDLADMTRYISQVLGFADFEAEAAIANYYHMDSTLSGHVDRSEVNQGAPLFSLSFGQTAIFLIGGKTKYERPQPVLLQSGDIAVMSSESRLSYHGVPKILPACDEPWNFSDNNVANICETIKECSSSCKRRKIDTSLNTDTNGSETLVHNCVSFTNAMKDHFVVDRFKKTEWTPFLESYIRKSRINLNIRQVLFPGQSCLSFEVSTENTK